MEDVEATVVVSAIEVVFVDVVEIAVGLEEIGEDLVAVEVTEVPTLDVIDAVEVSEDFLDKIGTTTSRQLWHRK